MADGWRAEPAPVEETTWRLTEKNWKPKPLASSQDPNAERSDAPHQYYNALAELERRKAVWQCEAAEAQKAAASSAELTG